MNRDQLLHIVQSVMAQPTAPFCEDAVRGEVLQKLAQFPHVTVVVDSFGNVIAHYRRGDAKARWVLSAHMDHPGYVGSNFLGGVPKSYLDLNFPRRDFGDFEMWDLPAFELRDGRIYSRACDDLIGCAVILATFLQLEEMEAEVSIMAVFTCAEEVGLLGAVHVARSGVLAKEFAILSLETSSERAPAKMGEGVIVRVGDRTSICDSDLAAELCQVAKERNISFQRCLMDGGTCEATAYGLYGYRVAGICVALGNYHNCGFGNQIEPEYVSITDVECMLALCVGAALQTEPIDSKKNLRERLERELAEAILENCKMLI